MFNQKLQFHRQMNMWNIKNLFQASTKLKIKILKEAKLIHLIQYLALMLFIKGNGLMDSRMELDNYFLSMDPILSEVLRMALCKEKVDLYQAANHTTKVKFGIMLQKEMECIATILKNTHIKENG